MVKQFLVVDDDADDRELFAEAMNAIDPAVVCHYAEDAEEALAKLNTNEIGSPNIIFLDINMPGMGGWECLKQLKRSPHHQYVPIIMYSTSSHQKDKDIGRSLGAFCFITKPNDYKTLRNTLYSIVSNVEDLTELQKVCKEIESAQTGNY